MILAIFIIYSLAFKLNCLYLKYVLTEFKLSELLLWRGVEMKILQICPVFTCLSKLKLKLCLIEVKENF